MSILENIASMITVQDYQKFAINTAQGTFLIAGCAYGGTFFFTPYHPMIGAAYFGSVALISQISYRVLEGLKQKTNSSLTKRLIMMIQLFQIPILFHLLGGFTEPLSGAAKLEIIAATAYFTAIPIFCYRGFIAWNDPTEENINSALAVMLPLASGLKSYAAQFK